MFRKSIIPSLFFVLAGLCILYVGVTCEPSLTVKARNPSHEEVFTPEGLYNEITCYNLQHPDIVFAQAVLETGHFKSNIFRTNNNLFGMRHPKVRPTTSLGAQSGHAKYRSWQESVEDYSLWQSFCFKKKVNRLDYLSYLSRNYAEDTSYVLKLLKIIKEYKHDEREKRLRE